MDLQHDNNVDDCIGDFQHNSFTKHINTPRRGQLKIRDETDEEPQYA